MGGSTSPVSIERAGIDHASSDESWTAASRKYATFAHKITKTGAQILVDATGRLLPYEVPPSPSNNDESVSQAGAPAPSSTPLKNIISPSEPGPSDKEKSEAPSQEPCWPAPRVLDDGCGSGAASAAISERYPAVQIIATDIAQGMLEQVRGLGLSNVLTRQCDALDLTPINGVTEGEEHDREGYSHVISTFMHQLTQSPVKAVQAMHSILRPGGVLGLGTWGTVDLIKALLEGCRNLDPNWKPPQVINNEWPTTVPEIEGKLQELGFEHVRAESTTTSLGLESAEDGVDYIFEGRNPNMEVLIKDFTERGQRDDLRREVKAILESGKYKTPKDMSIEMLLAVGRRPM